MSAPATPRVGRLERFLWFVVAALIAGVWVGFEALAGYEIPSRAHPVLALLVVAALLQGGVDLSRVWRYQRLVGSLPIPIEERRDLAARIAHLEVNEPELLAAIRGLQAAPAPKPKRPRTRSARAVSVAIAEDNHNDPAQPK